MRKILVTGGAGFIGSSLATRLVLNDDFVVVLDNFDSYYDPKIKKENLVNIKNKKNFRLIRGDILDTILVENIFRKYHIDYVIHLAAKVGVRNSIQNPQEYFQINLLGTLNLLEVVKDKKIKNLIFTSSSSVYGSNKKLPFSENDETDSQLSPYAVSKKSAELLCKQYSSLYGIPISVLRLFTVYGPRQRPDLAISKFINNITKGIVVEIFGNGNQQRDFIYIDDVIRGILKAVDKRFKFELFNLGTSHPVTINSLISYIEEVSGNESIKKHLPFKKEDMKITYADITKSIKLLKWKPKINISEGLKRIIKS